MRNVDKIKELKKKLAEAERYAARLETMCKGQDKQLMETQEGALELQRAMDGVLMAATLEHGEAVKNGQTGETVGWRLRIPDIDAGRMAEQYLLHARKDLENGMKRAEPDDLWPKPQYYSIYCPVCGRPAARLVYQEPVARYMHYGRKGAFWHGVVLEGVED